MVSGESKSWLESNKSDPDNKADQISVVDKDRETGIFLQASYTAHDPISINGNADFHSQAASEGWDLGGIRDGSAGKPYIIGGYTITNPAFVAISIHNTDLYFEITNNFVL
ncbi:MAG: hypothetical protein ACW98K_15565 [Candidatus Kariarchaeaceae archaeon]|jgi:hypothetical protein